MNTKKCSSCGIEKSIDQFNKHPTCNDGRLGQCKNCRNKYLAEWRKNNPNSFKEWRKNNLDRTKINFKTWAIENKKRRKEYMSNWLKINKAHINAKIARRNAAKKRASVVWADLSAIKRIYEECEMITKYTGIPHEVDHIVPLQSEIVCGLHWEGNLQILTKEENIRKLNRLMEYAHGS